MFIKDREIGEYCKPFVIAEIGINHGGDINVAKRMVKEIAKAGGECVKHQTHFVEDEMTEDAKAIYPPHTKESIWDIINQSSLNKDEEIELKNYAESLGLIYLSTPFSRSAADFLAEINIPAFKIGSGECDNIPLIRHILSFKKPVIMSTGMQSIKTIKKSVDLLEKSNLDYALLECTNLYPSEPKSVSLKGILELKKEFPKSLVGFSDHSIGPFMAIGGVALGACIIERHFTDSRYRKGPDILCSMDPAELKLLIDRSNEVFISRNNPKERTNSENEIYKFARGSIVSDVNLKKGQTINEKDIWARRPGNGEIPAYKFDEIVGKKINKDINKNIQLRWEDFQND